MILDHRDLQALQKLGIFNRKIGEKWTKAEVEKSFRKISQKAHPDKGGDPEAFRELQKYKDILISKTKNSSVFDSLSLSKLYLLDPEDIAKIIYERLKELREQKQRQIQREKEDHIIRLLQEQNEILESATLSGERAIERIEQRLRVSFTEKNLERVPDPLPFDTSVWAEWLRKIDPRDAEKLRYLRWFYRAHHQKAIEPSLEQAMVRFFSA